jgi:hypothetical protein
MRRLIAAVIVLLFQLPSGAAPASVQERPLQADPVVRLLSELETVLTSGLPDRLAPLVAPALPMDERQHLEGLIGAGLSTGIVRERERRVTETGTEVIVDVLTGSGRRGRIATWGLTVMSAAGAPDRVLLTRLHELAAVDSLLRLQLDTTRQFSVRGLKVTAPDLELTMSSGDAFVADSDDGITAIVLRGKGSIRFAPPHQAEQDQIRLFARRPNLDTDIDSAFLRVHPSDLERWLNASALVPVTVNPQSLGRSTEIFNEYAHRTYNLDLGALTPDRWSLQPSRGSLVVEFASRYGSLTYARSPLEPEDVSLFERSRMRNICVYASDEKLKERGRFYSEDEDNAYDVLHYAVDLAVDPARNWLNGRGMIRIRVNSFAATSLIFKLAQPLTVTSVSSPAFGELLALRIVGQNNVLVSLPRRVDRGTELELHIAYRGRLNPQPLDREAIAVQGQIIGQENTELVVVPEPRFLYSNRVQWYPQGSVSDYATAELRLSVPSEFQVVATGTPKGSTVGEGPPGGPSRSIRTATYSTDRPVRYLSFVISRFVPISRSTVKVPSIAPANGNGGEPNGPPEVNLEVVATPRMISRSRPLATRAASILEFFAKTIGEAPYPDFTLAIVDDNLPGGHSPASFALLHQPLPTTPYSWASDPVAFDNKYPPFFMAHEIAHQWWGQAIGWKNYHEQWLSEGFAQYFAVLYAQSDRGDAVLETLLSEMRQSAAPLARQGPISLGYRLGHIRGEGTVFRGVVYNKSAVVLHMLRRLMGDDAFFAGVRQFYRDWRFTKAGADDLRTTLEAHTDLRLTRFFDNWVRGSATPRVRLETRTSAAGSIVRLEQIGEVFDFPLTVEVQFDGTPAEFIDLKVTGPVVEHPIAGTARIRRVIARDPLTPIEIVR